MAYKFQEGAAKLDGAISGSSTIIAKSSISSSGDIAVTGAAHAAQFYGGGGNLTGISADAIDVTASTGDIAYPIVFTQGAQTNGSLGLGLNTALNYNPSDAILSSSAAIQAVGDAILGGTLNVSGATSLAGKLSSSAAMEIVGQVDIVGTLNVTGSSVLNGGIDVNGNNFTVSTAGAVVAKSTISASGVSQLVSSISSSGDLAVTGAVHAAQFYGGGAGITGITSDAVDVTASLGASQVYGIVGTQAIQSDGTLGLITTVSGASFNPLDATWGSKLLLSGNVAGYQTSDIQFGEKGGIGMKDDSGDYQLVMSSSIGACEISGAHDQGVFIATGDGDSAGFKVYGAQGMSIYDASFTQKGAWSAAGAISGAAGLQFVGASIFGNNLSVSGNLDVVGAAEFQAGQMNTVTVVTTNAELTASTSTMMQVVSGGTTAVTMIIPSASHSGYTYMIKRHSNMSGNVVITGSGGDAAAGYFIDGENNVTLETAGASVFLVSDGTNWNIF